MAGTNHPVAQPDIAFLEEKAYALRHHMVTMAMGQGQGYLGQGLAIADVLAALYFHEMRYDPADPNWAERDRFVMSTGHYSIALWAALGEAGVIGVDELASYGRNGSRLDMSTLDTTPGVEVIGGSLGQGPGQAVGMALGLRQTGGDARVFLEFSDGELQEGATWEALMAGATFGLDNLVAIVDCNGIQADGPIVMEIEPVADKLRAFGWETSEVNGNIMAAVVQALIDARHRNGRPKAIVARTMPGRAIPTLEQREKAHFIRIDSDEWQLVLKELEAGHVAR